MIKFRNENYNIRMKNYRWFNRKNVEITGENIENLQINQYNLSNQNKEK